MDGVEVKAKVSGSATMATVATALQLLQSATNVPGCPPAIAPVCSVALQVIQMAQTVQQNRETCNELTERISQIMVVVLAPYVKQRAPDMTAAMHANIRRLNEDLVDISTRLREVLGKNVVTSFVLSSYYRLQVSRYCTKLDWAMNVFKVDALLQQSICLDRIEVKLDKLTLQQLNPSAPPVVRISDQIIGLPPKPELFYGRGEVVEDVVGRLLSTRNGRFSIGGPGGLGKTSVALTSVHDLRVIARFGDRRYWVPCDQATSASSLIQCLARSLNMSTTSNDLLKKVVMHLNCNDAPKLMILDNFETPWDVEEERLDIGTVLTNLVSVPCVTLLLTVRSDRPPCAVIKWTLPVLKPLDTLTLEAARQLYIQWHPDAAGDRTLDTLLHELSYMPLAVTLMASRGAFGETPEELLTRWRSLGTAALGRSGTRFDSVQVSIRISTESRTMKSNPHALELLSLLTLLPAGVPKDLLPWMAPDIGAAEAFLVLQKVSLAYYNSESKCVSLLSPIQQYITEFHPPTKRRLDAAFQVYRGIVFAARGKIYSEQSWIPIQRAIITNFPNMEAIVLKRLNGPNPEEAIDLAMQICEWRDSPINIRVIEAASRAAGRDTDLFWMARCNYALAMTMKWTDRCKAISIMKKTLLAFRDFKTRRYILWSLRLIADWLCLDGVYEEAVQYAEEAAALARCLNDDAQHARSVEILARIDMSQGRLNDALVKMEQVHQILQQTVNMRGAYAVTESLLIYANLLRRCKRFEESHKKLEEASTLVCESADQGYHEGWRQEELGHLYRDQHRLDEALAAYTESVAEFQKGGYIGKALRRKTYIGDLLVLKGQHDKALAIFQNTLDEARESGYQIATDYCTREIGRLERSQPNGLAGVEQRPMGSEAGSEGVGATAWKTHRDSEVDGTEKHANRRIASLVGHWDSPCMLNGMEK